MIWEERATKGGPYSPTNPNYYFQDLINGPQSVTGEYVTQDTALKVSAYYRCVWLIASTLGTLPVKYYQREQGGGKREADTDSLWRILHDEPNPTLSPADYWSIVHAHVPLRGNHYSQITRNGARAIDGLWPLDPAQMQVGRIGRDIKYVYNTPDGKQVKFSADQIFHVRGLSLDGITGLSPITYAANALGIRMSQEKQRGSMFKNGFTFSGILKYPGKFKTTQAKRDTEAAFKEAYASAEEAGQIPVLEQGMDFIQTSMSAEDAEAIASEKFSLAEIGRFMGVPLHKLNELERATFSNIEEQNTDWVVDTVRPYAVRTEGAIKRDLIPAAQKRQYFAEFTLDALLRGNTEDRWNANQIAINTGAFSINEVRRQENKNPIEGGDVHLVPLNMIPLDMIGEMPESTEPVNDEENARHEERTIVTRMRVRKSYEPKFIAAFDKIVRAEVKSHRAAIEKHLTERTIGDFDVYLTGYYEKIPDAIRSEFTPVVSAYARAMFDAVGAEVGVAAWTPEMDAAVTRYVDSLATHYSAGSYGQLRALMAEGGEEAVVALETRLDEWDERKAKKFTRNELIRSGEEIAMATYRSGGVTRKRWHTVGKSCPMCNYWNGRVVGIEVPFAAKGSVAYFKEGEQHKARRDIMSPPLHDHCDCIVRAEI